MVYGLGDLVAMTVGVSDEQNMSRANNRMTEKQIGIGTPKPLRQSLDIASPTRKRAAVATTPSQNQPLLSPKMAAKQPIAGKGYDLINRSEQRPQQNRYFNRSVATATKSSINEGEDDDGDDENDGSS